MQRIYIDKVPTIKNVTLKLFSLLLRLNIILIDILCQI